MTMLEFAMGLATVIVYTVMVFHLGRNTGFGLGYVDGFKSGTEYGSKNVIDIMQLTSDIIGEQKL